MGKLSSSSRHMHFWLSCPFLVRLRRSLLPHPLSCHASLSDFDPSMSAQAEAGFATRLHMPESAVGVADGDLKFLYIYNERVLRLMLLSYP
ncbi:hypothetical protein CGRA01v4_00724 [Colletotrichum graminicola]|nr:hypothetical protein CGRA01v4_00724 [Colletotrichum graminicola]